MDSTQTGVSQGKTYYSESQTPPTTYTHDTTKLEGKVVYVEDREVDSGGNRGALRSGRMVKATIVRNVSGITLEARRACAWKSDARGKRVDGYTTTTAAEIAGIVDPHLVNRTAAGVRDDDLFLLYDISGPVECLTDLAGGADNVITAGSFIAALTAATSQATTAGRVAAVAITYTATQTTDGTAFNREKFVKAQAISAKTTANTNAAVLVGIV